jgi:hypothetical protein
MFILIHFIGEERALGLYNVRHLPDGTVLMTNPTAMLLWTLPFWALSIALIVLAVYVRRWTCPKAKGQAFPFEPSKPSTVDGGKPQ